MSPRRLSRAMERIRRRAGQTVGDFTPGGRVSVVVVCEPEDVVRLDSAVWSALGQTHEDLAVVVAPLALDQGETEAVAAAVSRVGDPRLQLMPSAVDVRSALAAAVRPVAGEQVLVMRGCDQLAPAAASALHRIASRSEMDVVVTGGIEQIGEDDPWLDQTWRGPEQGDLRLIGRMWPAAALSEATRAAADLPGEGLLVSAVAARLLQDLATGRRVARPLYRYSHDHGRRAYGATPSPLPGIERERSRAARLAELTVGTEIGSAWGRHVATIVLPRFLQDAERASEAQWATLRDWAASPLERPGTVLARILIGLAAAGRRRDLEAFVEETLGWGSEIRTEQRDGQVLLRAESVHLDDQLRVLDPEETPLVAHVHRRRPRDPTDRTGALVVDLFCRIRNVDLAGTYPRLEAWDGDGASLEVAAAPDSAAERWARTRFASAGPGTFRIVAPGPGMVRLRLDVDGLVRETEIRIPAALGAPEPTDSTTGVITAVGLEGDELVMTGTGDLRGVRLVDEAPGAPQPLPPESPVPSRVKLPLKRRLFGSEQGLPLGSYRLDLGEAVPAVELLDAAPLGWVSEHHRVTVRHAPRGSLRVELAPPYGDAEAGPYNQELLRAAYAGKARAGCPPTDPRVVYLESYAGRTATDSPAAILAELRRRHPDLTAYWGILDHSQQAPEGALPVVLRSRAHYDVLERASLVISNTDLDEWFCHRPDQLVVQTFHGYPAKAMGAMQWEAREFPPRRVRAIRRRTVATWDLIVTPTPEMTRHYREQYDYQGPVVEHGYPRDDALAPSRTESRASRDRVRHLFGISPEQQVVLYAPTWRDHLATRPRAAEMGDYLDVVGAAAELGTGHVLLVRGHRFHATDLGRSTHGGARIIDVTAYPEVNDLILACDVAVLDYSSIRFDVALAEKPMVFLVPDLAEYDGGTRGFLFPFLGSAPGPIVESTAAALAHLRDVPGLRADWADRLAEFNAIYHPFQDGHATERVVDAIEQLWPRHRSAETRPHG
ncbi:CDP-glycerol glycerophosphotransferase family protein [Nocardioides insulae]|uniref:CDP-glycerol glycerophosphotransferase family protein n=1 Tax=Nocardioides insulae TaxID=394734 RepID=UPI0012FAA78B|nr:CDP-glycerol glycerophosphotransferase family protein [Nocardioides insulae]